MEKKQRYCPSCGAKTNDAVCEICGRHTKPISERYHEKNLYIVEDDIASNEERQYRNEQKEKEKKTIENAASYERQAQHPNYEYKEFKHPEFEKPKFEHPRMKFERGKRQRQAHIYKEDKRQGPSTILKNAMGSSFSSYCLLLSLLITSLHHRRMSLKIIIMTVPIQN